MTSAGRVAMGVSRPAEHHPIGGSTVPRRKTTPTHEPSGLDEFHPDTTHNPAPEAYPAPGKRPPALIGRTGEPIADRRTRYRKD